MMVKYITCRRGNHSQTSRLRWPNGRLKVRIKYWISLCKKKIKIMKQLQKVSFWGRVGKNRQSRDEKRLQRILPVKLWMEFETQGVGNSNSKCITLRFSKIWATVRWSEWLPSTISKFNNNCLQCWLIKFLLWSIPRNKIWSINGMCADQSRSRESTTTSVNNITAKLHLKW